MNTGHRASLLTAAALALLFLVGGALLTFLGARQSERLAKEDLRDIAATAAASLEPPLVRALRGLPEDAALPEFVALREQLRRIRSANPRARFVYLTREREGRIVFLADAEPADSPDYSAPGDAYDDAPPVLRAVLRSGAPAVQEPYVDQWGHWVTGLAPVTDNGRVIAVLGIDLAADRWLDQLGRYRTLALLICLMFVLTALCLLWAWLLQRRQTRLLSESAAALARELEERRLAAAVIENTAEGVVILRADRTVHSANPAYERLSGYSQAELIGTQLVLTADEFPEVQLEDIRQALRSSGKWHGIIQRRRRNGERFPQETTVNPLRDEAGRITYYACIVSDFTLRQKVEDQLRELSMIDGLTGIANRRVFDDTLTREWARAERERQPLALLITDIDYFKSYNDRYGHLAGDDALRAAAEAMKDAVQRPTDLVARYGGEEFGVILPGLDPAQAEQMADKLRTAVATLHIAHEGSEVHRHLTVSIGCASLVPTPGQNARELVALADEGLYVAKRGGRNRVATAG